VQFFNEEELVIEYAAPEVKKTLPENALGMLNMYVGHPLFNHYINVYETQEILDDVLALVEEDSTLCNNIISTRENLKEDPNYGMTGRNEHPSDDGTEATNFDEALNKVNTLTSDRRMSIENAIDQVAKEIVGEEQDPDSFKGVVDQLWGMAADAGLVKHDFGSTFSDQVLAPNETVSAHNDEIDAEEFYGDARFAESKEETCACGCIKESCDCGPECDCGCNSMKEGDPFARQSKRNLANPKERMSLINPEDKISHGIKGLGEDFDIPPLRRNIDADKLKEIFPEIRHLRAQGYDYDTLPGELAKMVGNRDLAGELRGNVVAAIKFTDAQQNTGDVDEAKARPDWVGSREDAMLDRLDRGGYGDRVINDPAPKGEVEDKYSKMARDQGVPDEDTPTKQEYSKKPRYEEVEMPHHLPEAEAPEGTPELSEDGARIIQLARYKT